VKLGDATSANTPSLLGSARAAARARAGCVRSSDCACDASVRRGQACCRRQTRGRGADRRRRHGAGTKLAAAEEAARPGSALITPLRVLYIAGLAHCGSTLVSRVLGEIDGLFAAGEIYALSERTANGDRCGCGLTLAICPFWLSVRQTAFTADDTLARLRTERRWVSARTLPALAVGRDRERLDGHRVDLVDLYRAIAEVSGSHVVVDSSKSPTYAYILAQSPEIELCVVHLIRDPRATSYSWSVDPHFHRTRGPAFGARWSLWNLEIETLLRRRAYKFLRVRFEEFVENPVGVTRRILDLADVNPPALPFADAHSVRLPSHHMVEGHASRFQTGVVQISLSTAWRDRLSRRRDLTTSLFALPLQLRYGYSPIRRARRRPGPQESVPERRSAAGTR
jgi:hypothetical protein